jgi:hypothetical protein
MYCGSISLSLYVCVRVGIVIAVAKRDVLS